MAWEELGMQSELRALWRGQDGLVRARILWEGSTVNTGSMSFCQAIVNRAFVYDVTA